eukprot:Sdes_comp19352_c1_seq1m10583
MNENFSEENNSDSEFEIFSKKKTKKFLLHDEEPPSSQFSQIDSPEHDFSINSSQIPTEDVEEFNSEIEISSQMSAKTSQDKKKTRSTPVKSSEIKSSLPLLIACNKRPPTILFETKNPDLDMSGDIGSVGRFHCNMEAPVDKITLDVKGYLYKGDICACNSFMVVNIGATEAKVETIIDSFFHVVNTGSALDTENVTEGVLQEEDWAVDSIVVTENPNQSTLEENQSCTTPSKTLKRKEADVQYVHSEQLAKNTQSSRVIQKKKKLTIKKRK